MNWSKIKEYFNVRPKIKKIVGVVFIIVGLLALFTPLTPGSWLALIGLEFLGIRLLFLDTLRKRLSDAGKFKFWNKK